MGNLVHRETDLTTGHDCWLPEVPASWSPDVTANGLGVVRQTDARVPHTCPSIPETHGASYIDTRGVTANGLPIQVIGSPLDCGDFAAEGSPDVFMGD